MNNFFVAAQTHVDHFCAVVRGIIHSGGQVRVGRVVAIEETTTSGIIVVFQPRPATPFKLLVLAPITPATAVP